MTRSERLPDLPGFDSTPAFLREGYAFVSRRCRALRSDGFRTRLMLRPVTCLRGAEAAREFYRPGRMTRRGAMPTSVVALLQGKGSVQALDDAAHRVRKAMFLRLMTRAKLAEARRLFAGEWEAAARSWQGCEVVLADAVDGIMTRTALRWCGIDPGGQDVAARAEELTSMVGAAGSVGPAYLRARWLRARSERWARRIVARARRVEVAETSVLGQLVRHTDADGAPLSEAAAAVELLNLLRPIVAVGRYVVFAAHALHVHRETIPAGRTDEAMHHAIGEEVRRLYPFFPMIGGRVREGFDWHGTRFEAGDWLLLDLYGTNRDAAAWASPESFLPERHLDRTGRPEAMVPQGGGDYLENHRCPGEWLTEALLTEAVGRLRAMRWEVPEQDLGLPGNAFPPLPGEGMRIAVAPAAPGEGC